MSDVKPPIFINNAAMASNAALWEPLYTVHKITDYPDLQAFIDGPGQDVEVIVSMGEPLTGDFMAKLPKLGLVACASTGYQGIDYPWLKRHGIPMTTAASVNANDVADHALTLTLGGWRRMLEADRRVREGRWGGAPLRPSLRGLKAGVVGLGHIGREIADRMAAFGIDVSWWGPRSKPDAPYPRADSLLGLAQASAILVIASRAVEANRRHIDRAIIEAVGPDGLIVNISRGMLIDEDAMIDSLRSGKLGYAALDVFEQEPTPADRWRDAPNTLLSDHIAGASIEALPAMRARLHENVRRYFAREPLLSPADDPV